MDKFHIEPDGSSTTGTLYPNANTRFFIGGFQYKVLMVLVVVVVVVVAISVDDQSTGLLSLLEYSLEEVLLFLLATHVTIRALPTLVVSTY